MKMIITFSKFVEQLTIAGFQVKIKNDFHFQKGSKLLKSPPKSMAANGIIERV